MRAQIWSADFAASVVIFISVVTVFFFVFQLLVDDAGQQQEILLLQESALEATESLVRTPGSPPDWASGTVQVIGLAARENVLNRTLVLRFVNSSLDYNTSKTLLGIRAYEYSFTIEHPNGSIVSLEGMALSKGLDPAGATDIALVERPVLLEGPMVVRFIVWT